MPRAVRIHGTGGPEVLQVETVEVPAPGRGEVRVRQTAVGVNFIDVYHRTGVYALPLPAALGQEAAGVVEALGPGVHGVRVGDRVAYAGPQGAYCDVRNVAADRLVHVPEGVDDATAAAVLFKGLTAEMLVRRVARLERGDTVLLHAAAGGVGRLVAQWARHLGAQVIGLVSSDAKVAAAREAGCAEVLVSADGKFAERVRQLRPEGVRVVLDSVGSTTDESLRCLRTRGLLVSFGQSGGKAPPIDVGQLGALGSLAVTRPSIRHFTSDAAELRTAADALFAGLREGWLTAAVDRVLPLDQAADAHRALESRRTVGAVVLRP